MSLWANIERILFKNDISRRQFGKICFFSLASAVLSAILPRKVFSKPVLSAGRKKSNIKGLYDVVTANGNDPFNMTVKAVESMGGISRFVRRNSVVVIKPNIGWDRAPEYAATTNPQVVAALVELCLAAGAKRVNVFDRTCNSDRRCYANSGIQKAAEAKGAKVYFVDDWNSVSADLPYDSPMQGWPVFRDAVECDTFINVPVLKNHGLTRYTISMKNLMGVCGGNRGLIHNNIGRKLVDITDFISPDLTVIDAFRVLVRNGPTGGDLNDVKKVGKVIVATDPVLADSYACRIMGEDPMSLPFIAEAVKRKLGSTDITNKKILELNV